MVFGWILVLAAVTALLAEIVRRGGFALSVLVFFALPVGLVFLWPRLGLEPTGFEYVKVFSVSLGALFISGLRWLGWVRRPGLRLLAFLILFVNVLEAMVTETFSDTYINFAAGGLLLLSQALPHRMRMTDGDEQKNLRYDLGMDWVLAYTLWNFTFVYGTNPPGEPTGEWAAFALVHLTVPLILMRGNAELYIQNRAYSLALLMMLAVTLPREPFLYFVGDWHHPLAAQALRIASLTFAGIVCLRSLRPRPGSRSVADDASGSEVRPGSLIETALRFLPGK
ncbi:MAG: DUF5692 family protein [Leptospirales bacterium]|jgi:hypothetical protein